MSTATVSIRDLRLNFRAVKQKIEEYGSIVITDNGVPSYELKSLPKAIPSKERMPDYYARLLKQRPTPISKADSEALHRYNRGDR